VLVAVTIALASQWLAQHYGAPVMLFALLFGMTFHFLHQEGRCIPGIEFSSKAILRFGVALLGARITASQILGLGLTPIITVIVGIGSTIALGAFLARRMGLRSSFGVLSGGAVGICGASAALAIASVLPRGKDAERDTILAVVTVTALSTIAMITYPLLTAALHLDHTRAGIFLGGTIHDVAQVVGAGYMISPHTGDVATYVKLLRVTMLLPVVFGIAFVVARMGPKRQRRRQADRAAVPDRLRGAGDRQQPGLAGQAGHRRGQRDLALVPGHGHRRPGHEDLVQGPDDRRLAARGADGLRDGVDRRGGAGGRDVLHLAAVWAGIVRRAWATSGARRSPITRAPAALGWMPSPCISCREPPPRPGCWDRAAPRTRGPGPDRRR
jgi:uncharacterized integral membrane protein (TIGR00698 family)